MFKLLRLAIYAIVGYTAYQLVMEVVNGSAGRGSQSGGGGNRGGGGGQRQRLGGGASASALGGGNPMTATHRAGGQGKQEVTQDFDGGSVRHRVGRGVV
jgi:hypothetical protein